MRRRHFLGLLGGAAAALVLEMTPRPVEDELLDAVDWATREWFAPRVIDQVFNTARGTQLWLAS